MAIPDNYIDKITKDGESRMISPAADKVRVDSEHYEGDNLDDVLDEIAEAIDEAGSGDGTVKGVKVGSTTYDPDSETGVVDLSTPIAGKADKVPGKGLSTNDYTDAEKTKLQNLPTADGLTQQLSSKANAADVAEKLSQNDISVEAQGYGTVVINVGSGANKDTYTINLNHTHENMCKLVVCEENDLPSTLAMDTIYCQVDDAEGPGEIQKLWIAGLEFAGGAADTGLPTVISPSDGSTINMGANSGSGLTKTITIRAKNLSSDLTVAVSGTGLSMSYGQQTGQSSITIAKNSNGAALASVDIVFSGTGGISDGSLTISSGNDTLAVVTIVVENDLPVGYTRLEYVDNASTGILTSVPALGSTWEVDVQMAAAPAATQAIICTNEDIGHWFGANSSGYYTLGGTGNDFSQVTTRSVFEVEFISKGISVTYDGTTKSRTGDYEHTTNNHAYYVSLLYDMNKHNTPSFQFKGKVFSIKCTSGGIFNGVPALNTTTNKKGIYDKANNTFYQLES